MAQCCRNVTELDIVLLVNSIMAGVQSHNNNSLPPDNRTIDPHFAKLLQCEKINIKKIKQHL